MSRPPRRTTPRKKPSGGCSPQAVAVLRRCVDGGRLSGFRRFPYPYTYCFGNADYVDAGDRVTLRDVAQLIEAGYLTASQPNPTADVIHYDVTDAGRSFARNGAPKPDDAQLDWTQGGAA